MGVQRYRTGGLPGWQRHVALGLACLVTRALSAADGVSPADAEFFEKHIRPVLAQQCFECHSGSIQAKGGLRLDIGLGLRLGGQRGETIVPGNPDDSILIKALKQTGQLKMPPGDKLSDEQIGYFEEWVRNGAIDPRQTADEPLFAPRDINFEEEGKHWAYQPAKQHPVPQVSGDWAKTDIDKFIAAKLESKSLSPANDASRATWLRRVYLDLIGLPPTPGQIVDFELDNSPEAHQKVVDRLLATQQFGERWARHWLDVVRYGESTGKERNFVYLQAWRYRDYVIDSFNADKPYDQFLREQIAGDLLPHANDLERDLHQIATGFLALNPKGINDRNRESFLLEIVDEQIESVGRGLMAESLVCARCHDHKYDPIKQSDYYAIGGIFRSTEPKFGILNRTREISVPDLLIPLQSAEITAGHTIAPEILAEFKAKNEALANRFADIRRLRDKLPPKKALTREEVANAEVKTVVIDGVPTQVSSARDQQPKSEAELEIEKLDAELKKDRKALEEQQKQIVQELVYTMSIGVQERSTAADIPIRIKGEVDQPGPVIPRGFLTVLQEEVSSPQIKEGSGRLELAQWLTHPNHPLVPRVYVNRIWSKLLGAGIVSTVDDFGTVGQNPSHPELLDNLAVGFVNNGWSTKKLIREIVLSRVYALSDIGDPKNSLADVDNRLLWKANRKRLDAEVLRDVVLSIGGNLDLTRPSGTPLTELGVRELGADADYSVVHRPYRYRSVYLPFVRGRAPEMLAVFDAPDPSMTVGKRDITAGPDQALYLLNSPLAMDQARLFAQRLLHATIEDPERVDLAFRLTLGSNPTATQRSEALQAISDFQRLNSSVASTGSGVPDAEAVRLAAWTNFTQTLFALPEFRYAF
jgi:hypothetical protein